MKFSNQNAVLTFLAVSVASAQSPEIMEKMMREVMTANLKQVGNITTRKTKLKRGIDSTKLEMRGGSEVILGHTFTKGGIVYAFIVEGRKKAVEKAYQELVRSLKILR